MQESKPSELMIEQVADLIQNKKDVVAENAHGIILKGLGGGLDQKAILVGTGSSPHEATQNCLNIVAFLRSNNMGVGIWLEILERHSALIIDKPSIALIQKFNEYEPSPHA